MNSKYTSLISYGLIILLILTLALYLYLNILQNRQATLENGKRLELFLDSQVKNRNGIERNYKLLQKIDREITH